MIAVEIIQSLFFSLMNCKILNDSEPSSLQTRTSCGSQPTVSVMKMRLSRGNQLFSNLKVFYVHRNDAAVVSFTVLVLTRSLLRHMNIHFG
jgi:hypothetical protein